MEDGFCPNCGAEVTPEERVWRNCKAALSPLPVRSGAKPPLLDLTKPKHAGCLLSFLLPLLIAILCANPPGVAIYDRISLVTYIGPAGIPAFLSLAAATVIYFAIRRRNPVYARGFGYGLLLGLSLALGMTAVCGGFTPTS